MAAEQRIAHRWFPARRGREAIPLGDAGELLPLARRTRTVRIVLALALLGTLAGAAVAAPRGAAPPPSFVPPERSGVIALDVSASVSEDAYGRIESALRGLGESGGRYGLVVFSDTAYEALPPGTPASELDRFADIFHVPGTGRSGVSPKLPPNPWTKTFVGGTQISSGLRLAEEALLRGRVRNGAVILISDLDDDPTDSAHLVATVLSLKSAGIPLRVIGLNPSPEDAQYFDSLLSRKGAVRIAPPRAPGAAAVVPGASSALPGVLIALTVLFAIGLALNEWEGARLTWRQPAPGGRRS